MIVDVGYGTIREMESQNIEALRALPSAENEFVDWLS
jgi:hypothetical protein